MKRSQRLAPILKLAHQKERMAARELGKKLSSLTEAKHRLMTLVNYKDDYHKRVLQRGVEGVMASDLKQLEVFLKNLADHIESQKEQVAELTEQSQQARAAWLSAYNRQRALDNVQVRYQEQEQHEADKKEQRQLDEFGLRCYKKN